MQNYTIFFGFCMFVIGAVVGRLTMAIQYEVMKTLARSRKMPEMKKKSFNAIKPETKLEYRAKDEDQDSSKKELYDFMKNRPNGKI
ncbi:MAG: hypothetical protein NT001_00220 [Candidatus Woesearchaeota archaeon]|nr:hypothetical protein [Candidatus Woesearchaeota archaeon]